MHKRIQRESSSWSHTCYGYETHNIQFWLFYKVYNLVPPSLFTMLCNCQCCLFPTLLNTPRTKCESWKVPPHSLPPSPFTLVNPFIYFLHLWVQFRSVQFSRSVVSNSLRPHEMQHVRPPCPTAPGVYSNSHPLTQRWHPTVSSSSSPSPPAFNLSQHQGLFKWVSSLHQVAKVLEFLLQLKYFPMNIQDWFPLRCTGWISLQSKGHSRVFPNTKVQKHQFLASQLSLSPTLTSIHDYWKNHSFD